MTSRGRILLLALLALLALPFAGRPAHATNTYTSYFGPNFSFTGIQETSSLGDPELPPAGAGTCCWDDPAGVGDALVFSPASFTAQASGAGGYDGTGALLQLVITATGAGATIDQLYLTEYGDATLDGPTGTGGTGVFATMAGYVTVLETTGGPIAPVVIGFNAGGASDPGVTASFSPAALGDGTYALPTYAGLTYWNGQVIVDLASIVPNATKIQISYDDDLYAYSEAEDNSALIRKTSVIIGVVPEPGTSLLFGIGLLALAMRARVRRE